MKRLFWMLVLFAAPPAAFRAGAEPEAARFGFEGVVFIDRAQVTEMLPLCRFVRLADTCRDGKRVRWGDPVIVFDTEEQQERIEAKRHALAVGRADIALRRLQLAAGLQALRDRQRELEGKLAVAEAAIRRLSRIDQAEVDLLAAHVAAAEHLLAAGQADLGRKELLHELGELSGEEIKRARLRVASLEDESRIARLEWDRARGRIDSLAVARRKLERREILMELGRYGGAQRDAAPAPARGIARQILALEREIEEKVKRNRSRMDREAKRLHEARRNAYDRTPLNWLEILPPGGGDPLLKVNFQPANADPPPGFVADHGGPYAPERGYGWNRDLSGTAFRRAGGEPRDSTGLLLRNRAVWRCRLAGGVYRLRIGVGDDRDWHGPLVRVLEPSGPRTVVFERELRTWKTFEAEVTTEGPDLVLLCDDDLHKALRAPHDGVVRLQPWLRPGLRLRWKDWPLAYLCDPARFAVKARAHEDIVPFLRAEQAEGDGEPVAAEAPKLSALRLALARARVAVDTVRLFKAGGESLPGRIGEVGSTPVRLNRGLDRWFTDLESNPLEQVAREVVVGLDPAAARKLRLGGVVHCTADIRPDSGMRSVPCHLVARRGSRTCVAYAGEPGLHEVESFRVGARYYVLSGLAPGKRLAPPLGAGGAVEPAGVRFPGHVVAGRKSAVRMAQFWGRIGELVPDGSMVTNGQHLISLYNPDIEANRERLQEAKDRAREDFLVAAETRRVKSLEAQRKHAAKLTLERRERLALKSLETVDPLPRARAEAALRAARLERQRLAAQIAGLETMGAGGATLLRDARRQARIAELRAEKAYLKMVAVVRSADWVQRCEARARWADAIAALALHEEELAVIRKEESVSRLLARLRLGTAMEGNWLERAFEAAKDIYAPATGRLFYAKGWNDLTQKLTKIGKNFVVWGGLTIAEILDMTRLAMEVELPEDSYGDVREGDRMWVGFDLYPGVKVPGVVDKVGSSFAAPRDMADRDDPGQVLNIRRSYRATIGYRPPAELAHRLVPGTKGYASLEP